MESLQCKKKKKTHQSEPLSKLRSLLFDVYKWLFFIAGFIVAQCLWTNTITGWGMFLSPLGEYWGQLINAWFAFMYVTQTVFIVNTEPIHLKVPLGFCCCSCCCCFQHFVQFAQKAVEHHSWSVASRDQTFAEGLCIAITVVACNDTITFFGHHKEVTSSSTHHQQLHSHLICCHSASKVQNVCHISWILVQFSSKCHLSI